MDGKQEIRHEIDARLYVPYLRLAIESFVRVPYMNCAPCRACSCARMCVPTPANPPREDGCLLRAAIRRPSECRRSARHLQGHANFPGSISIQHCRFKSEERGSRCLAPPAPRFHWVLKVTLHHAPDLALAQTRTIASRPCPSSKQAKHTITIKHHSSS